MRPLGLWTSERSLSVLAGVIVVEIFLVGPLTQPAGLGNAVLGLAYLAILVSGIATVACKRVAAVAISTVALFCLLLSAVVFRRIFRTGHVSVHRISGAVAAYLLIGLVFAYLYDAIELLAPGSFYFATAGARNASLNDPMIYFSFTTLTTVGYGDVTPQNPLTQSLANLESLIGQLFPAILIARLVALELLPHPDDEV